MGYNCAMRLSLWPKLVGTLVVIGAIDAALILAPAFRPIPRESTKSAAKRGDDSQRKGYCKENPSPTLPLVKGVEQSVASEPHGEGVGKDNKQLQETTVTIRSLPQISVAKNYPIVLQFIYDWGPWVFAMALVIVGTQQAKLLNLTLKRVSRQADLMDRQNTLTREAIRISGDAARAAKESADAANAQIQAMKDKERARIRLELLEFKPETITPIGWMVKANVFVYGTTHASIDATKFLAIMGDQSCADPYVWNPPINIPNVVIPNSDPIEVFTLLHRGPSLLAGDEGIEDVISGKSTVYCVGLIKYTDVFGGQWEFRFSKKFVFWRVTLGIKTDGGTWENHGPDDANGEYKEN